MTKLLLKFIVLVSLIVGGGYGVYRFEQKRSLETRLQDQINKLEQQREHLRQFVSRLTAERRVAEMVVTDQVIHGSQIESTTLMFVEYGRDGQRLPPRFFTVRGNVAHIDALVIKFERDFIEQDDPLRGHSLVLFHRLYGDHQAPIDGFYIDEPGNAPAAYRDDSISPEAAQFEAQLWRDFWQLADDPRLREEKGVRVVQGEGPWTRFHTDRVYTLSLEADGGLNISSRPIDGLFKEFLDALRRQRVSSR
jgi:hypothetical protein